MVAGERYSGLEVPNAVITTIGFKDVFEELPDRNKKPFNIPFGKNISGKTIFGDYTDFPHMLVAGTTGSGKSVFVHSVITTLIMRNSPDDLKLILIDPKMVEMNKYVDMPHLLCPIIYEAKEAKVAFDKLCEDMDDSYATMRNANVTSIKEFNEIAEDIGQEKMPIILVVVDEYADLVEQCKEIQIPVSRISAKARASGIHLLVATQRPSVNVVTGVLKSNLPTHVALKTSNYTDSMTILNEGGAEKLLGKGDMLIQSTVFAGQGLIRIQSPFIKGDEIGNIVNYLKQIYEKNFDCRR
jgi:S-DNA-T family DNA segregation ATPase FtsK/SpoIIIE